MYPYGDIWGLDELYKECKKQGDFCFTIGIIALLIGMFFIIGNFTII